MESKSKIPRYAFDRKDHELIRLVNEVLQNPRVARTLYYPYFHPNGIKEMVETRGLRSAFAVAQLLSSLAIGGVEDRLNALRSLRLEVIDAAQGPLPRNTARVLLQIMKELVRAFGDRRRQLELAHEFRMTASGKPRLVRRQLRQHHLLEMPEEWNQIAFDDHVHDVNTKGRKSSTHLLMDAWIKGIRRLRIIHYNFIEPRFAAELFAAARILDIDVRIGIEFSARFRDTFVQLIWVPRGFADAQAFLCFLAEPPVMRLMDAGRITSLYQQEYVIALLSKFNAVHRTELNARLSIELAPIDQAEFLAYVGIGQKSKLHLSKFIYDKVLKALQARAFALGRERAAAAEERRREASEWLARTNSLDLEALIDGYLEQHANPEIVYPDHPVDSPDAPELLRLSPQEMLGRLIALHAGYRVTLNLTNLKVEEVLELLYDCQGMISRLEIFNLKDYSAGKTAHVAEISTLMQAINEGSVIRLKQVIREIIDRARATAPAEQIEKLKAILYDIDALKSYYAGRPLKSRIGSDSAGRSARFHGMGLAILETLPPRARREIARDRRGEGRETIPVRMMALKTLTLLPAAGASALRRSLAAGPLGFLLHAYRLSWRVETNQTRMASPGNLVTLGGFTRTIDNGLRFAPAAAEPARRGTAWAHVNTRLKNTLKILLGFAPAFATFALTKDWWLLAYGGAFIWFAITGLRNILQSVLGGGGLRRSPLLNWNDYVSWSRIVDSLMYTGFSVPLLDYLVKTVILDRGLGVTTANHPLLLYAGMGLANGIYLSAHNLLRGLPRGAVFGNFFRSIIAIPVAVLLNATVGAVLAYAGAPDVAGTLQKWAAIISKTASDTVAGFIEGLADRHRNIRNRLRDYQVKFDQLFAIYAQLELLYPEVQTFAVLRRRPETDGRPCAEARDLEKIIMIHALDLLYFWMYQPRARTALTQFLHTLSEDERHILASSQFTLQRHREISQMFIDGILGNDFPQPLSFYLERYPEYLERIKTLVFGRDGGEASDPLPIDDPLAASATSVGPALVPTCGAPSESERQSPCKVS
jgi:hypothetical protein